MPAGSLLVSRFDRAQRGFHSRSNLEEISEVHRKVRGVGFEPTKAYA